MDIWSLWLHATVLNEGGAGCDQVPSFVFQGFEGEAVNDIFVLSVFGKSKKLTRGLLQNEVMIRE